jgi:hypothetical protein
MPNETIYLLTDVNEYYDPNMKTIFVQMEPEAIQPLELYLMYNHNKYTYIITFNENILRICPNARPYIVATAWITLDEVKTIDITKKRFEVSSVFGNKLTTVGHNFRRNIFLNRDMFKSIPCNFFLSCNADFVNEEEKANIKKCHPDTKFDLFKESQFHLVIENSRQTNYFTEKLLDTLITYTIPIYYGCPNIDEFFDTSGWIILETDTLAELEYKLGNIDELYYTRYLETVLKNQKKAVEWMDLYTNLNNVFKQLPEFKNTSITGI